MRRQIYLSFVLLASLPVWGQATGSGGANQGSGTEMLTPAPVSDQPYSNQVGVEVRSNFLSFGLTQTTSYVDNYFVGGTGVRSETSFAILPTVSFDQNTGRQDRVFTYSPGFMFYQPDSQLNEIDQTGIVGFSYRMTPHTKFYLGDDFVKSSNSFNSAFSGAGGAVSGSAAITDEGVLAPFAERITNAAAAGYTQQIAPRAMVGVSGYLRLLDYPKSTQAIDLYDSHDAGGSAFYDHQLSASQYLGVQYADSLVRMAPLGLHSNVQTQTMYVFYTYSPDPTLSLSVSGGPQHFDIAQTGVPNYTAWEPSITGSMGWQTPHTNLAASYAHEVTAGGGLLGAFETNTGALTARWKVSPNVTVGALGSYAINKTMKTPVGLLTSPGGHSIVVTGTMDRALSEAFHLRFEYDRIHQTYADIPALAGNPNADRIMFSLVWQATRPLGQ